MIGDESKPDTTTNQAAVPQRPNQPPQSWVIKRDNSLTEPIKPVSDFGLNDEASSTSMAVDPELGSVAGDKNLDLGPGPVVTQRTICTRRKLRAICVGLLLLTFIFVLFLISFNSKPKTVPLVRCDLGLSPPYSSNRSVNWEMCIKHKDLAWNNSELTEFLLPAGKATDNPPIRFLVVGDFGRDGFCTFSTLLLEFRKN